MIRHIALFTWKDGTTAEQIAEVTRRLEGLGATVPGIRAFACGPDVGGADGHWDYAVNADFDDLDAYRVYATHPDHLAVIAESIVPHRADRAVLQIEIA